MTPEDAQEFEEDVEQTFDAILEILGINVEQIDPNAYSGAKTVLRMKMEEQRCIGTDDEVGPYYGQLPEKYQELRHEER